MRTLLGIGVLGLALAACGNSSHPAAQSAARAPSATTAAVATGSDSLRQAVQAYSDAYLTGDAAKAYGLLSRRCQARMGRDQFAALLAAAKQMYGSALPIQTYHADVSGNMARVTYTYSVSAIDQKAEPWVKESGNWHQDDC